MGFKQALDVELQVQRELDTVLDGVTVDVLAVWQKAYAQVENDLELLILKAVQAGELSPSQKVLSVRLARGLAALDEMIGDLVTQSSQLANTAMGNVIDLGVNGELAMYQAMLGNPGAVAELGLVFARPSKEATAALLARVQGKLTAAAYPIQPDAEKAIKARLISGMAKGDNPVQVARDAFNDVSGIFHGGMLRAVNITRTEMLDALRIAQAFTDKRNGDILKGWIWYAHLDSLTCRSCVAMHGTQHDIDEAGPLDHHRGRCARVPLTKSWADLGFPGIDDDPLPDMDGEAWLIEQPVETQQKILGQTGWRAWQAGDWGKDQWAKRVENDAWRPAYVAANQPTGLVKGKK